MNKKRLAILLIASITITSLFAYTAPSVVLTASKTQVDYQFKVQKLNDTMTDFTDLQIGDVENVILDENIGTTNAFTIATIENGNMPNKISFSSVVTTGEFLNQEDETIGSGWFPTIVDMSLSATVENFVRGNETVIYTEGIQGDFTAASTGTYETTFSRGRHLFGTEIARFKLQYKADDELVAGSYRSTTIITISVV